LYINNSVLDIIDANIEIFKHAKKINYNNILILEDDFIFSNKIKNKDNQTNINKIINNLKNKNFIYLLGCFPLILIPFDMNNSRTFSRGTHAVIYSKKNRNNTLNIPQEKITDWDIFNDNITYKYTYNIPLCYQLVTETQNSKNWGIQNEYDKILAKWALVGSKFLKLDINPEPGTTLIYNIVKILFFLILFIICIICTVLIKIIIKL